MSKKLIAVASAAALALTGLVGIAPASASVTLAVTGQDSGAGTSASPYLQSVPEANILDADTTITVKASAATGASVTVTTTGGVKVIDALTAASAGALYSAASGLSSWTDTATATGGPSSGTGITFYIYNTSTTAGTFTVSTKTATSSATGEAVFVKGVVGKVYSVTPTVPATIAAGTPGEVTFVVKDVFGNAIEASTTVEDDLATDTTATPVISGDTVTKGPQATWDANRKVYSLSLAVTKSTTPVSLAIHYDSASAASADVAGLAKRSVAFLYTINGGSATAVNDQIAALTAQLAASRPKATSVTKKRFNTLARKWNAAFPSQKVALKK